jgi:hypothetical protein
MSRRLTILSLVVLVGLVVGCAKTEPTDPVEQAWSEFKEAWSGLETAEDKSTLAERFLADFPNTEHSGTMASIITYYRGHEMDDPEGAYGLVSAAFVQIDDPAQRFEVGMEMLGLADSVDVPLDLGQLAGDLAAVRPLTFGEHQQVFETAAGLEEWSLAQDYARAATVLATPETYRADYPDREFTDEDIAQRVRHRHATALAYEGWAAYNQGDRETAFAKFAAADDVGSVSYLGVPNTPLYTFWGRAALAEGEIESAIELLGAEASFGDDPADAMTYLREAYVAKNGDEEGFDEFLWSTRNELASEVDDFTLLDYQDNEISLAEIRSGKVTLLAFWFPT